MGRRHALTSVRRRARRRCAAISFRARSTTCRPARSAAAKATRGRRTDEELAYTAKDQGRDDASITDVNLYTVPSAGGAPTVITAANKGADQNPVYSPDGRFIAYASQARAGFESDRWRLMVYDRSGKTSRELLPKWDRNADAYFWAPDMSAIYVQTTDAGRDKLYRVDARAWDSGSSLLKPARRRS